MPKVPWELADQTNKVAAGLHDTHNEMENTSNLMNMKEKCRDLKNMQVVGKLAEIRVKVNASHHGRIAE